MEPKIRDVVNNLLSGTRDGVFSWETTERQEEFRLRLQKGFVSVDKWEAPDPSNPYNGEEMAEIVFYNIKGEKVDRLGCSWTAEKADYDLLVKLQEAAKRNALKIDEVLDSLFEEISDKSITF